MGAQYVIDAKQHAGSIALVPTGQQFVCKKCGSLATIETFEQMRDGNCGAKNAVVQTGVTASQPGLLPVTRLLDP